jgi:hypothetical protein
VDGIALLDEDGGEYFPQPHRHAGPPAAFSAAVDAAQELTKEYAVMTTAADAMPRSS